MLFRKVGGWPLVFAAQNRITIFKIWNFVACDEFQCWYIATGELEIARLNKWSRTEILAGNAALPCGTRKNSPFIKAITNSILKIGWRPLRGDRALENRDVRSFRLICLCKCSFELSTIAMKIKITAASNWFDRILRLSREKAFHFRKNSPYHFISIRYRSVFLSFCYQITLICTLILLRVAWE